MRGNRITAGLLMTLVLAAWTPAQPVVDPADITGRDFAGMALPLGPVSGELAFAARRVRSWTEGGDPATHRLLLEGDVEATIAEYTFRARRAAVWLAPSPAVEGATQVFVYFDTVTTPTAAPGFGLSSERLPVEAVVVPPTGPRIRTDLLVEGEPDDAFVREAQRALASYLRSLLPGARVEYTGEPGEAGVAAPLLPSEARLFRPAGEAERERSLRDFAANLPIAEVPEPIFAERGVFSFVWGSLEAQGGQDADVAVLDGGIVVQYADPEGGLVQMTAQRGVVFLRPGRIGGLSRGERVSVRDVTGVYLEGDVYVDGTDERGRPYAMRSPRVFYDVANQRALLVDAVFWTHDRRKAMTLYLRAEALRQEARNQFSASRATVSNTAFARPHLSIGASSVSVRLKEDAEDGGTRTIVDARHITLRAGRVPFFYWPIFYGDPERIPLRGLAYQNSNATGGVVSTRWDPFTLSGIEPPAGADADLLLDGYFERGLGIGVEGTLNRPDASGSLLAYTLPDDRGTDVLGPGVKVDRDGITRSLLAAEYRKEIDDLWTLWLQGWYASDPAVTDALFRPLARTHREFRNSAVLARREGSALLSIEASGQFDDFVPNQYLLQTPGYSVEKLPEVALHQIGVDVLGDEAPGLVTYNAEYRLSRMRLALVDPPAREFGFRTSASAGNALGVFPAQSLADRLRAEGFTEAPVQRLDTRQEMSAQLALGPINVVPFAVARATVYDDTFEDFSPGEDDSVRLWGSAGVTLATSVVRVDEGFESEFLDAHRLRHIVEPSVTVWHAATTVDRVDLPVYDASVEGIGEGTAVVVSVDQTLQTQRGGPGRWRSVDLLTSRSSVMVASDDVDLEGRSLRLVSFRPELSNFGDFFQTDAVFRPSEVLALTGGWVYDLKRTETARANAGFVLDHTDTFSTWGETRFINALDSTYFSAGTRHQITPKYLVVTSATYDSRVGQFQSVNAEVERAYPNVNLGLGVSYNNITSDTSFGVRVAPKGIDARALRLQRLGGRAESSAFGALGR